MTGYRVCLDCDRRIAVEGDAEHKVDGFEFIGCEGYRHSERERAPKNAEVIETYRIAGRVLEAFTSDVLMSGHTHSEDYADAFHSVGQLFMEISAQMLHEVYKDDDDGAVRDHMNMVLKQATEDGDDARVTLVPFIPSIDQI